MPYYHVNDKEAKICVECKNRELRPDGILYCTLFRDDVTGNSVPASVVRTSDCQGKFFERKTCE